MKETKTEKIGRLRAKYEQKKGKTVVILGRGSAFYYLARTRLDGSEPLGSIEGEVVGVEADAVRVFVERLDRVKRVYFVDIVE